MTTGERVARNIRAIRRGRDWTQSELCERLAERGLHWDVSIASKVEKCQRKIYVDELAALAEVFEVPVTFLVNLEYGPHE